MTDDKPNCAHEERFFALWDDVYPAKIICYHCEHDALKKENAGYAEFYLIQKIYLDAAEKENASLRASLKLAVEALEDLGNSYVELYPNQLESRTSLVIAKIKATMGEG
jgi:hypothetical protein